MALITYVEALQQGLREELRRDERVFLIGEDIGAYGGAFKVTKGLLEEFGANRVIDTPISEAAIVGAAVGTAVRGMRPIAEMQFSDFITNGFNQVVNIAATTYYRWRIPVPMVLRCPSGGGFSGGPFHSRNTEAWFTHQPGLKIVCPATAYDVKGLFKTSVRDSNPVLFLEHKNLYRKIKDEVPDGEYLIPFGEARIARSGRDATVVTYGSAVHWSVEAANHIAASGGASVEVIDVRTLVPLDIKTIISSVIKTGRALVAHEDNLTGGFGAEIAAQITDAAFEFLDAPVRRIGALDIPTPYAPALEAHMLPNAGAIESAINALLRY